ncbi:MAG: hypothetical protein Q4G65_11555 [bacterium]|nr:hypothetical protein [bacterium]
MTMINAGVPTWIFPLPVKLETVQVAPEGTDDFETNELGRLTRYEKPAL